MRRFARFASLPALAVALTATGVAATEHPATAADPTGQLDLTYGDGGSVTEPVVNDDPNFPFDHGETWADDADPSGRLVTVATGGRVVRRLTADGAPDVSFAGRGFLVVPNYLRAERVLATADGLFLAGEGTDDGTVFVLALQDDGSVDADWGDDGMLLVDVVGAGRVTGIRPLPGGHLVVAVDPGLAPGDRRVSLLGITPSGALDEDFGDAGVVTVTDLDTYPGGLATDGQGRVLLAGSRGSSDDGDDDSVGVLRRFLPDGAPDTSFGTVGTVELSTGTTSWATVVDVSDDGVIDVGGNTSTGEEAWPTVWRLNERGVPDTGFGPRGARVISAPFYLDDLAALPGGRVAVQFATPGDLQTVVVLRPDGATERGFGDDGTLLHPYAWLSEGLSTDARGRLYIVAVTRGSNGGDGATTISRYTVEDLPATAPTITEVRAGRGSLSVAWDAVPADDVVQVPRGYLVLALHGDDVVGSAVVVGDVGEATVGGLPDGTPATVRVIPVTDGGLMRASAPATATPSATAPPPYLAEGVRGLSIGATKEAVTAAWAPPVDDGGSPIAGYAVAALRHGDGALLGWRNVAADVRSASVPVPVGVATDVYVLPFTGIGFGTASGPLTTTATAAAPASPAPTLPWATAIPAGDSVRVSWGAPEEHGQVVAAHHVLVLRGGQLVGWYVAAADARSFTIPDVGGVGTQLYVAASSSTELGPLVGPLALDPTIPDGSLPTTG